MYATINAATNNIPTTYGTGAGSLILNGSPAAGQLTVINTTGSDISFSVTSLPGATPVDSTTTNTNQYIVVGGSTSSHDKFKIATGDRVFIKSLSGSVITSGKVHVIVW